MLFKRLHDFCVKDVPKKLCARRIEEEPDRIGTTGTQAPTGEIGNVTHARHHPDNTLLGGFRNLAATIKYEGDGCDGATALSGNVYDRNGIWIHRLDSIN